MDDGMNDDAAASRTTPSEQSQKKPGGAADSGLPEAHFQGFREKRTSHGILGEEGIIGKHFKTHEGGEKQGEGKTKHIDRSELYGGYGA